MKNNVQLSKYYDDSDHEYWMIECYYDDCFCYVIDYENVGNGQYNLDKIYNDVKIDLPVHAMPFGRGYGDNMYILDYAFYLDFHPKN